MIVSDYGFEEDAIIAAILHDTLEDTDLDRRVIRSTSAISCWPLWKTSPSRPRQSRGGPERKPYIERKRTLSRCDEPRETPAEPLRQLTRFITCLE